MRCDTPKLKKLAQGQHGSLAAEMSAHYIQQDAVCWVLLLLVNRCEELAPCSHGAKHLQLIELIATALFGDSSWVPKNGNQNNEYRFSMSFPAVFWRGKHYLSFMKFHEEKCRSNRKVFYGEFYG